MLPTWLVYLLFGGLFISASIVAFGGQLPGAQPQTAASHQAGGLQNLRTLASGRLRAEERAAARIPLLGAYIRQGNRQRLRAQIRDRLPSFWGDLAIYFREGRRDLSHTIAAAIDRLEDPLSTILAQHLRQTRMGRDINLGLREATAEIDYAPLTTGIEQLLTTYTRGGDLPALLDVLRDQAMAQVSYERDARTATLETRLIVMNWPLVLLSLMLAVLAPIIFGSLVLFM